MSISKNVIKRLLQTKLIAKNVALRNLNFICLMQIIQQLDVVVNAELAVDICLVNADRTLADM